MLVGAPFVVSMPDKVAFDAVDSGDHAFLGAWLDAGGNVNATCDAEASGRRITGVTLLMRAAGWGHVEIVNMLLSRGARVNEQSSDGFSALLAAVMAARVGRDSNLAAARALMHAGADMEHCYLERPEQRAFSQIKELPQRIKHPKDILAMLR